MADLFIGYARQDRQTTEKLASALEAAGHSVWWDRQIVGGSEFSKDIERELGAARAAIIIWSVHSRESSWVKDEAGMARDLAKLVPISLDREPPPLGFRQYQAIDFSRWNGRADNRAMHDLLRALDARLSGVDSAEAGPVPGPSATRAKKRLVAAALVGLLAVVGAWLGVNAIMDKATVESEVSRPVAPAGPDTATMGTEPRIAVAPIKVRDSDPELADLAAALGEDIASGLSRFSYLLVASRLPGTTIAGDDAGYVLEGALRRSGSTLRLTTQLINVTSGEQVWGETFDRPYNPATLLETQDDLTDHVVASVADPYGALMRDLSSRVALLAPDEMTPYETILRHFIYRQRIDANDHLVTRDALERGVQIAPGNADIWASLAALYTEEYKHGYNEQPGSLDRALEAARTAVDLQPDNAYANFILAEVYFFRQDLGAFRAAAERAIALNPRDTDAVAMIGIMTGYGGDWVRSVELTTRAMELNPNHPGWYRFNTFFNEFRQGHYEEALAIAQRINMPDYFADPYARAISYAELGRTEEAQKALDEFRALWPGVSLSILRGAHLQKWFYAQPELIEQTIEGLRKAGLESK